MKNDLAYQHFCVGLIEGVVAGGSLVHVPELPGHAATEHVRLKVLMKVSGNLLGLISCC